MAQDYEAETRKLKRSIQIFEREVEKRDKEIIQLKKLTKNKMLKLKSLVKPEIKSTKLYQDINIQTDLD